MKKSKFISFNGDLISSENFKIHYDNRAFKYGDSIFESARSFNTHIPLLKFNYQRLLKGLNIFNFNIPEFFTFNFLEEQIQKVIKANKFYNSARIRITIYRDGESFSYLPINPTFNFLIEAFELNDNEFKLNEKGLIVDIYDELKKPITPILQIKNNCSIFYILPLIWAKSKNLDDAILLNTFNYICEATSSNIIIVDEKKELLTPLAEDGCIVGTMLSFIETFINIKKVHLTIDDLLMANEIIFTNAINGIKWISEIKKVKYSNSLAKDLLKEINQRIFK